MTEKPAPGESWAYRARGKDPLVEVKVMRFGTEKPPRVLIQFADERKKEEWVPPSRLKTPWNNAAAFSEREQRWARLEEGYRGPFDPELNAAEQIIELFMDKEMVEIEYNSGSALRIKNFGYLMGLLRISRGFFTHYAHAFAEGGDTIVPWPATIAVGARFAEVHPEDVLRYIADEEARAENESVHGMRVHRGFISAEVCKREDEEHGRPTRRFLRAWCRYEPQSATV
ncbi:hypothetical protein [Helcobacillus massiliensis]|uniref:Uncharacterized protein n=1 Tax=Helcobacillus massiliensis TaxID=521392 RepID=A0A839QT76_9MICO|nr:hypothetical protein [Helcobacillus massiliensis]MBB3022848.1 hypothetical protein [Helcobacillus massiliensis]